MKLFELTLLYFSTAYNLLLVLKANEMTKNTKRLENAFQPDFLLDVEAELHDVPILNHIFFSFFTKASCFFNSLLRAVGH